MRPAVHWWSNSPQAPTGYGVQTRAVTHHLADAGFPVSIASNYGLEAVAVTDATDAGTPLPIYPRGYDGYSQDTVVAHYMDWARRHADRRSLLATLYDVWVLTNPRLSEVPAIASWVPLDHITMPPAVKAWLDKPNVHPVAMSEFGQTLMAKHDVDSFYIPHTFAPTFRPMKSLDGLLPQVPEDAFLVMLNAANKGKAPTRKAWTENFLALTAFMQDKKDVHVYVHTEKATPFGIDLNALAAACGLPADRLHFPPEYAYRIGAYSDEMLARIYSRADVLLAVSMGEGFGIPTIEAQACGTRVIGSDCAATPELLGSDSWLVQGQPEWDPAQQAFWFRPFVHSIREALLAAYAAGGGTSHKAVSYVGQYAADKVLPAWVEVVEKVAA